MNEINYKELYDNLLLEFNKIKEENIQLSNHLKKYTAPERSKKYYENHKEECKLKVKEYKEKTEYSKKPPPEKIKEYSKRAYEKKKLKILESKNSEKNL
jgi:hypothetical protein